MDDLRSVRWLPYCAVTGSMLKSFFATERALATANAYLTALTLGAVVAFVLRSAFLNGPVQATFSYWVPIVFAVLAILITAFSVYLALAPGSEMTQKLAVVRETFLDGQTTVGSSARDRRKCLRSSLLY